jgi:hypothetical protein
MDQTNKTTLSTPSITLTPEQEEFILKNYKEVKDLNILTQKTFNDESLDGRTIQGKLVRSFLVKNKIPFNTTKHKKVSQIELTESQKHFVMQSAEQGMGSFAIAQLIFPEREVKNLGVEQRAVLEHIRTVNENFVPSQETGLLTQYSPPKTYARLIKKIFDATGYQLEETKISRNQKNCLDKLAINLSNSRFVKIINNYSSREDRILFEEEFVRLTWDKPDLTADELNLYMNVCKEIINLEVISKHLNKLNGLFDDAEEQQELTVRLAEIIKAKSAEYHQCEGRIEALTKKLQGDRSERMKNRQRENASILSLVQMFQEEEERKNMIRIAEMQKELIAKEADVLEGMAEFKARVLGISKEDVI